MLSEFCGVGNGMKFVESMKLVSIIPAGLKRKSEDIITSCLCGSKLPKGICICDQSMPKVGLMAGSQVF